jgi:hypothetical protein
MRWIPAFARMDREDWIPAFGGKDREEMYSVSGL